MYDNLIYEIENYEKKFLNKIFENEGNNISKSPWIKSSDR